MKGNPISTFYLSLVSICHPYLLPFASPLKAVIYLTFALNGVTAFVRLDFFFSFGAFVVIDVVSRDCGPDGLLQEKKTPSCAMERVRALA